MRIATKGRHKVLTQNNVHSQGTCTGIFNFPNPTSPGSAQGLRLPRDQRDRGGGLIKPVAEPCGREGGERERCGPDSGDLGPTSDRGDAAPPLYSPGAGAARTPHPHHRSHRRARTAPGDPSGLPAAPRWPRTPRREGAGTRPGPLGPRGRGLLPLGGAEGTRA